MTDTLLDASVLGQFQRICANRRLAHAYLFAGPRDSGKTQTAFWLAGLVNCESSHAAPCQECSSCRKIRSGNHPDIHVIGAPDGQSIKIEDIRFLLSRIQLKAYEAKEKCFILRNVETMTPEAANALLKVLEEPSPHTLMVLTTSLLEDNLATIKSRCQIVRFFPASLSRAAKLLAEDGCAGEEAMFLADYAEGCLGQSRRLAKEGLMARRRQVLNEMLTGRQTEAFVKQITQDPQQTAEALRILYSFFKDVILLKCKVQVKQPDFHQEMEKFARRDLEDLLKIVRQIVQTKKLAGENLNVKMSLSLLKEYIWGN